MEGTATAPAQDFELAAQIQKKLETEARMKGGASWFFWIAGLSAINSAIVLGGSNWHFLAGLGITDVIAYIAQQTGSIGTMIAIVLDALVFGMFILFGVFARKRQTWAFIVGMTFYGLDGLIYLLGGPEYFSIAFHVFVLFQIFKGMQAAKELSGMEMQTPQVVVASAQD